MEILKTSIEWAKAEIFSSWIFVFFGLLFLMAFIGFWQMGKTDLAKAFMMPMLISGTLLLAMGLGFYYTNKSRLTQFEIDYKKDAIGFVNTEIERTARTLNEYQNIAFKVFPIIIAIAALLIVFIEVPVSRAITMTTIGFFMVILLIDSHAHARLKTYHIQLQAQNI